ncbi:hypothetical protein LPJ66_010180 [Kickxella alabastrina]|uniref:Uncharacterized protein n=1 Tax=Kickxella alabastrina TaxID=61397 RepID=A0ACC1I3F0_9FUNG|nr:hypothetical protein LPJ66_010180 [Kickxella alabastrina]
MPFRDGKHHWEPNPCEVGKANCKPKPKRTDGDTATDVPQPVGSMSANIIGTYGVKCKWSKGKVQRKIWQQEKHDALDRHQWEQQLSVSDVSQSMSCNCLAFQRPRPP